MCLAHQYADSAPMCGSYTPEAQRGDAGSGGDGICGNGDDNGVSGDDGGIGIAKNLSASSLVKDSVGG
uniref:Uncharacterized protein n=1 Tax=Tanacetum cinerariifolium TaxID=118510 RepID=A0A699REL8_TANCI|nr:hypothetical protein [Tanacetum cinerariifolium]